MNSKLSRNYRQLHNGSLVTFGGHVKVSITGNPNFPTPIPTLTAFDSKLEDYSTSCINFQKGNVIAATIREEARAALIESLNMLANYVELTSEFKEGMMVTSGFDLQKEKSKRPIPSVPVLLDIADGVKSGQVKLKVDSSYASNFTTMYKVTGSEEQPQYKFGETKRLITIDGLEAGKYYTFLVSAANAAGESGWSAEQSFLVR